MLPKTEGCHVATPPPGSPVSCKNTPSGRPRSSELREYVSPSAIRGNLVAHRPLDRSLSFPQAGIVNVVNSCRRKRPPREVGGYGQVGGRLQGYGHAAGLHLPATLSARVRCERDASWHCLAPLLTAVTYYEPGKSLSWPLRSAGAAVSSIRGSRFMFYH